MNSQRRAYKFYKNSDLAKKCALIFITSTCVSLSFGVAAPPLNALKFNFKAENLPPHKSHVRIVPSGTTFTINCTSNESINFTCPLVFNPETKKEVHDCYDGRFSIKTREFNGIIHASLTTMQFASYLDTGSYGCKTKSSIFKQYIFVEEVRRHICLLDPNRWLLPMKRVYHIAGVESVIPCKPTHPDISILLLKKKFFKKTSDGHSAMEIVYSPTNEKQDAKDKIDRIWSYDPLEGFRLLEQAQVSNVEGAYECRAEKRSATGTVYQMGKIFEIKHSLAERPVISKSENENDDFILTPFVLSSTVISLGFITLLISLTVALIKAKLDSRKRRMAVDPHWEFPRCRLKLQSQLDIGCFGRIIKAEARGIVLNEPVTTVAVKTVHSNDDYEAKKVLLEEFKILSNLGRHLNIVNLLGACTNSLNKEPLLIIFEYCPFSNLRTHMIILRRRFINQLNEYGNLTPDNSQEQKNNKDTLNTCDLINWAYQISRGMAYLALKKVLHRDLAARNILLAANNIVKISDFGMSLQTHSGSVCLNNEGLLPIKWMSIEALKSGIFSSQSDVWSFGVVLWELFSLGKTPYTMYAKANKDVLIRIFLMGRRLKKPIYAPEFISQIMYSCWHMEPLQRPTFHELEKMLYIHMEPRVVRELVELDENEMEMRGKRDTTDASCCI